MSETEDKIQFLRWTLTRRTADDWYRGDLGEKYEIIVIAPVPSAAWEAKIRLKGEQRFELTGTGSTLPACEKSLLNALGILRGDMDNLCVEVSAPPTISEAVSNFVMAWAKLPPLVRAATAACRMRDSYDDMRKQHQVMPRFEEAGLTRRKRVHALFQKADLSLYDLFVTLTKQADDEAEDMGIDADTRYRGPPDLERPPAPRSDPMGEAVVGEMMRVASEQVADEIDRQVVEDLHGAVSDGLAKASMERK